MLYNVTSAQSPTTFICELSVAFHYRPVYRFQITPHSDYHLKTFTYFELFIFIDMFVFYNNDNNNYNNNNYYYYYANSVFMFVIVIIVNVNHHTNTILRSQYEYRLFQAVTELRQKLLLQRKYSFYLKNVHFHHPACI